MSCDILAKYKLPMASFTRVVSQPLAANQNCKTSYGFPTFCCIDFVGSNGFLHKKQVAISPNPRGKKKTSK